MVKPVDVSVTRVIGTDRPTLAHFAADMSNVERWYRNIKSVEWKTTPSCDVGAQAAFVAEFMGRRIAYTYEIREHMPGERLVMSTEEGPFPMQTIYEWSDAPRGTRMRLTNRGFPSGYKSVLMPLMALAMRRAMTQDLAQLDRVMRGRR
ncbi:MAG: SRPBCC family protein [Pseudomonadota bacterium]|nr:SRPBCC family protein [Pseudomonadota bacterium]